jgi:hypothetical protein
MINATGRRSSLPRAIALLHRGGGRRTGAPDYLQTLYVVLMSAAFVAGYLVAKVFG